MLIFDNGTCFLNLRQKLIIEKTKLMTSQPEQVKLYELAAGVLIEDLPETSFFVPDKSGVDNNICIDLSFEPLTVRGAASNVKVEARLSPTKIDGTETSGSRGYVAIDSGVIPVPYDSETPKKIVFNACILGKLSDWSVNPGDFVKVEPVRITAGVPDNLPENLRIIAIRIRCY